MRSRVILDHDSGEDCSINIRSCRRSLGLLLLLLIADYSDRDEEH